MKESLKPAAPLSPAILHILLALAAGDLHGYGIILEVARQSGGSYKLGPGTLYDNLKKLIETGLVADAQQSAAAVDDDRRFYTLTIDGRKALGAEIDRMQSVVHEARLRLEQTRPKRA